MGRFKIEKLNIKRWIVYLIVAFLVIVSVLAVSSNSLNHKINEAAMNVTKQEYTLDDSSKTILHPDDEQSSSDLENDLSSKNLEYTKLSDDIYIVNYKDAAKANQATYETYSNAEGITANEDSVFQIASFSGAKVSAKTDYIKPSIPEGMSLRDYANSTGKKIIAIIDTGVSSDLAVASKNFTTDSDDDKNGHGTSMANAVLDNANDNAIILSLKAMNDTGAGYLSNIIQAIDYAREQQVDIINLSIAAEDLGGTDIFKQVVQNTIANGIKVVAAAGNYGTSAKSFVPANIEGVESIGAYTTDDNGNKSITANTNYDAMYYEEASTTSEAAAMHSGRLASGSTEFVTETELVGIPKTEEKDTGDKFPILQVTEKETYSNEDNTSAKSYISLGLNLSNSAKSEIYATKGTTFISSPIKADTKDLGATKEIYDEKTKYYHYVFSDEDKAIKAKELLQNSKNGLTIFISDIPALFSTQAKTWGYSSEVGVKSMHASGSASQAWGDGRVYDGTSKWKTMQFSIGAEADGKGKITWDYQGVGWYNPTRVDSRWSMIDGNFPVTVKTGGTVRYSGSPKLQTYWGTWKSICSGSFNTNGGNVTVTATVDLSSIDSLQDAQNMGQQWSDSQTMWFWANNSSSTCSVTVFAGYQSTVTFKGNGGRADRSNASGWKGDSVSVGASHEKYTLKLDPNGGSVSNSSVQSNDVIFSGWDMSQENGHATSSGTTITFNTANTTATARWNSATVSWLPTPARTGYTFQGWYTDKNGGTKVTANSTGVTGNWTLYAHWSENTYKVKYDSRGTQQGSTTASGSTTEQSVKYTDEFKIQQNGFTKEGYTFTGWNSQADGKGTAYAPGQTVKSLTAENGKVITLYAMWRPNTYTIHFDSNSDRNVRYNNNNRTNVSEQPTSDVNQYASNSALMTNQNQTYDAATNLSANKYSWKGHTFLGWSLDKNATSATWADGEKVGTGKGSNKGITSKDGDTVTLYAVWRADNYVLTIDPSKGNGTWNGSSSSVKGEDANHTDGRGNTKWGDKVMLGDATPVDRHATVTYDVAADDATIDRTSDTVKWIFSRWKQNKGAHGLFYNNDQNSNDENNGSAERYYIIQDTADTLTAVYYFQTVTLPTPTREGYTFLGWYEDSVYTKKATNGGNGNGGSLYRTESDITLYARWQKNSFNYTDTEQVFMQDQTSNRYKPFEVWVRKADAVTRSSLTTVDGEGFKIGIYKNSVADGNLKLILDTSKGICDANDKVISGVMKDKNGYFKIFSSEINYLEKDTTYIMHEISAAPGYYKTDDVKFTTSGSSRKYITMYDTPLNTEGGSFKLTKVDDYGRPLKGAKFTLYTEDGTEVLKNLETDENGELTINLNEKVKAGQRYKLVETIVPEGFKKASDTYFQVPDRPGEKLADIDIVDITQKAKLRVHKVNSDDEGLKGAVFQLYMKDADGELVPCYMDSKTNKWVESEDITGAVPMVATTDTDGYAEFKDLPIRASYTGATKDETKSYYLKELQAPEGYNLLPDIMELRLPNDGSNEYVFEAKDDSVTLTLEAGGNGTAMYYGIGFVLIALASLLTVKKKSQN